MKYLSIIIPHLKRILYGGFLVVCLMIITLAIAGAIWLFVLAILKYPFITLPIVFIILAYLVGMMVKNNEGDSLI